MSRCVASQGRTSVTTGRWESGKAEHRAFGAMASFAFVVRFSALGRNRSPKRRIRKRKDGHWEGRYTAGCDPTTGKPIHKSVLAKTQAEAKEKLKQAIAEAEKLDMSRAKSYTLGAWIKLWYEVYAEPRLREKTRHYYLNYIDNHIIPELGNTPLEKLTTI